jgi:probable rRNA maturation factor
MVATLEHRMTAISVVTSAPNMRAPLSAARVTGLVTLVLRSQRVRQAAISVTFLASPAMARLNRRALGHRGATDIITFELPQSANGAPVTGDIYIGPDVARANAKTWNVSFREEIARLVIHGTLHTLGFTHPDGDERVQSPMWRAQERYLRRAYASGLI